MFIQISQVINSYSLDAVLDYDISIDPEIPNRQFLGVGGAYGDRPTITYFPLQGEQFMRRILTPLPPEALFMMVEGGWPVDFVFRLCIREINGIDNHSGTPELGGPADPEFSPLLQALRRIQRSGVMGSRVKKTPEGEIPIIFFGKRDFDEIRDDYAFIVKTLNLNPEASEFKLVFGRPQQDDEIALLTRSMLDIMIEAATSIDVPTAHVDEQRTQKSQYDLTAEDPSLMPLLRVRTGKLPPGDAFVAVRYRNSWFWIDDRDFASKQVFSFFMLLFTFSETGGPKPAPVITIPAG
jgi:hypothetical protein